MKTNAQEEVSSAISDIITLAGRAIAKRIFQKENTFSPQMAGKILSNALHYAQLVHEGKRSIDDMKEFLRSDRLHSSEPPFGEPERDTNPTDSSLRKE